MVSANKIKGLDFETIEEYFQYIIDSITNGQKSQAKNLFIDLSAKQKLDFYHYVEMMEQSLIDILDVVNV